MLQDAAQTNSTDVEKMREALHWDEHYQFYSLKDSGIRDLANSQGVVIARDQARHSDITTTNKYIQKHGVQKETLSLKVIFPMGTMSQTYHRLKKYTFFL